MPGGQVNGGIQHQGGIGGQAAAAIGDGHLRIGGIQRDCPERGIATAGRIARRDAALIGIDHPGQGIGIHQAGKTAPAVARDKDGVNRPVASHLKVIRQEGGIVRGIGEVLVHVGVLVDRAERLIPQDCLGIGCRRHRGRYSLDTMGGGGDTCQGLAGDHHRLPAVQPQSGLVFPADRAGAVIIAIRAHVRGDHQAAIHVLHAVGQHIRDGGCKHIVGIQRDGVGDHIPDDRLCRGFLGEDRRDHCRGGQGGGIADRAIIHGIEGHSRDVKITAECGGRNADNHRDFHGLSRTQCDGIQR